MKPEAFHFHAPDRDSRWLVTCDHASNDVPADVGDGDLGLRDADMARHIAYDVGAAGLTCALADALDAPAILSDFSRLVIDPNRAEDDPTLLMKLYDGTIIPTNRHAGPAEKARRLDRYYRPYHAALETRLGLRDDAVMCAIHSFTPQLRGHPRRPWQVGVLSAYDKRLTDPFYDWLCATPPDDDVLAAQLAAERWCVGDNEPYGGHFPGDSVDVHALRHGRLNVLIELRHDLIETDAHQRAWAAYLAEGLQHALTRVQD